MRTETWEYEWQEVDNRIPDDFPVHIPEIEREYRQSSWMLWTFSVIRIIVIEVKMVFGLWPGLWAGCLGPWDCGNMFNTPFLDKPRMAKGKMWCRTGIQRTWALVLAMLLNLLWEFGQAPSFLCAEASLSTGVGGQELWSILRWTTSFCSHGSERCVDASVASCCCKVGFTASGGSWITTSFRVVWAHPAPPGLAMPCTQWMFSKCLFQECIGLNYGQQIPEKQWFWQDGSLLLYHCGTE